MKEGQGGRGSNKEVNASTISYKCLCVYDIIYINISYIT